MSYRRDLKRLRRARRLAKRQEQQLAELELTGLTAITLHTHDRQVTIALASITGAPFTDALRELLRERREALRTEAHQLLLAWLEEAQPRDHSAPRAAPASS